MTDVLKENFTVTPLKAINQALRAYSPDWSNSTMSTINEMTSQFYVPKGLHELHSQFYGWLPSLPTVPSTQGDPVTWVLLGIIGIILIYKL